MPSLRIDATSLANQYNEMAKSAGRVYASRSRLRTVLAQFLVDYIRFRVGSMGRGKNRTRIPGYSTSPVIVTHEAPGQKRMRRVGGGVPVKGGKATYYKGGYKAYVAAQGRDSSRFTMTNTGALWRDFKAETYGINGGVAASFKNSLNIQAMLTNMDREGRRDMLALGSVDMDIFNDRIEEFMENNFYGNENYAWKRRKIKGVFAGLMSKNKRYTRAPSVIR